MEVKEILMSNINTILPTLAGALIGGLIGFWVSRATTRDQFFYTAAAKLRQTFNDVLVLLNLPEDKFIDMHAIECMDNSFWQHERAVIEFRYALPKFQRCRLDKAWEHYKGDDTGPEKLTKKYFGKTNWQQIALKDIEAILDLTEHNPFSLWQRLKSIAQHIIQLNRVQHCP